MNHPLLAPARHTVVRSCRVARRVQQTLHRVREITKDDRSPVTVADFAVQAIIAMDLRDADPDVLIVGEEKADVLRRPEQAKVLDAVVDAVHEVRPDASVDDVLDAIDRCDHDATADAYWALDPIDGTKGFLRGQQFAIALGRIEGGVVTLGVMGCPHLPMDQTRALDTADAAGVLYVAVAGGGAWELSATEPDAAPRRIEAVPFERGKPIRMCESVEAAHSNQSHAARVVEALGGAPAPVRLDSQCKYAVVARGQADAYLRLPTKKGYVEKIWDHAAGSVIASEAGAVITDITGRPLQFDRGPRLEANRGVVCAVEGLHGSIIDAIREVMPEPAP